MGKLVKGVTGALGGFATGGWAGAAAGALGGFIRGRLNAISPAQTSTISIQI